MILRKLKQSTYDRDSNTILAKDTTVDIISAQPDGDFETGICVVILVTTDVHLKGKVFIIDANLLERIE